METGIMCDDRDNYFGHCLEPEHKNFYLNIRATHWFYCDTCHIKWYIGENLFSSWLQETEQDWQRNFESD